LSQCNDTIQTVAQIIVVSFQILRFCATKDSCNILHNIENQIMPVTVRLQVELLKQLRLINLNAFFRSIIVTTVLSVSRSLYRRSGL